MFDNASQLVEAELDGRVRTYDWRKIPTQVTVTGLWFDLAMSPGNPSPKFWFDATPYVAKTISQSQDGGLFHGANVSPSQKVLRVVTGSARTATTLPLTMMLCDYLLYYPSCDDGTTDEQVLDNTVTLPRYTDGKGVQMMAVSIAGRTGGSQFRVKYTNQDGVTGQLSPIVTQNSSAAVGQLQGNSVNNNISASPFIPLASGDSGVRKIESVTMLTSDVGLFSLVLVKPLARFQINTISAALEKDYYVTSCEVPEIKDDAFLGWLCQPLGSISGTLLRGDIKVVWR